MLILVSSAAKTSSGSSGAIPPSGVQACWWRHHAQINPDLSSEISSATLPPLPTDEGRAVVHFWKFTDESSYGNGDIGHCQLWQYWHWSWFLGTTLCSTFSCFWIEKKKGHFEPKASQSVTQQESTWSSAHYASPCWQQQSLCGGRGALEGISELLQAALTCSLTDLRHKCFTRCGSSL